MKILICKSHTSGGANYLLDRLYVWLMKNGYHVEQRIVSESVFPEGKIFDLAILPSYVMNDVYLLRKMGIKVDRILLWIMGAGCFQDGYYNPFNKTGVKGLLTRILSKEAERSLNKITELNSICFTDVVGRLNTYKEKKYANENFENHSLIPIGVSIPEIRKTIKKKEILRVCWLGRVSMDFKYIPLRRVLFDLEKYKKEYGMDIEFTVVGDGDALSRIKEDAKSLTYLISYIHFMPYDKLDAFFECQDIAFVMGTSALDAARNSCPAVIVTSVRFGLDEEKCFYRWIYESKGYSLGEYPGWDTRTHQVKKTFNTLIKEYYKKENIAEKCYEHSKKFDENIAFKRIFEREIPKKIDKEMWRYIRRYYLLKKMFALYSLFKNKMKNHKR